eukprot:TRINITY_DN25448_c0_g1_i1.p1 TRINITY_DN25448_c0_g1~~TRINITY_DN25448_c0_g1_i1.p1  ORF type:complete len:254 (+),score=29.09 TRINITY_DN25448_c0_g1_i1:150-911(+)
MRASSSIHTLVTVVNLGLLPSWCVLVVERYDGGPQEGEGPNQLYPRHDDIHPTGVHGTHSKVSLIDETDGLSGSVASQKGNQAADGTVNDRSREATVKSGSNFGNGAGDVAMRHGSDAARFDSHEAAAAAAAVAAGAAGATVAASDGGRLGALQSMAGAVSTAVYGKEKEDWELVNPAKTMAEPITRHLPSLAPLQKFVETLGCGDVKSRSNTVTIVVSLLMWGLFTCWFCGMCCPDPFTSIVLKAIPYPKGK